MKTMAISFGAALGLALAAMPAAHANAQEVTAETIVDQAQIRDLLTRYYYTVGHGGAANFAEFYTEDAEFVIEQMGVTYKGLEEIAGAYSRPGATPDNRPHAFNALLGNPLIIVRGDTATAELIFTEVIVDRRGAPPRLQAHGREYDNLVKQDGRWLIKRRVLRGGNDAPEGWNED